MVASHGADDGGARAGRARAGRARPHRHQQCGALHPPHEDRQGDRGGARKLEPSPRGVPRQASRQVRLHGDLHPRRRRCLLAGAGARRQRGRRPRRHHQLEPPRPLPGRGRREAVLQAGDRSRHPGLHPSRRCDDAGDGRLPSGVEHRPAGGQLPVAGAADRARHLRAVSRPSSSSAAISAAASAR